MVIDDPLLFIESSYMYYLRSCALWYAVERFSLGVRNPTSFLAGALVSHYLLYSQNCLSFNQFAALILVLHSLVLHFYIILADVCVHGFRSHEIMVEGSLSLSLVCVSCVLYFPKFPLESILTYWIILSIFTFL